jgi:molybdopterin molybdotransferase
MLTVEEALRDVLEHARRVPALDAPLDAVAGCTLAEDVSADMDLPPFDKALVDGYAVRSDDLRGPERWLHLAGLIPAGQAPTRPLGRGEAVQIMTGAPVPVGCDAVVMHERTRSSGDRVFVEEPDVRAGQNILPRGREMVAGEVVVPRGSLLTPAQLGVLASVGKTSVKVLRPRVAIVPTGDELVESDRMPGPGQIRNSNAVMLRALAVAETAAVEVLPIAPDEPAVLREFLARGLEFDVLITSGGVSAGQRDLVPSVLGELGARRIFHKVRLKPGKPLWFGTGPPRDDRPATLVFGLPGNPVSSLVGFFLFVRPALAVQSGRPQAAPGSVAARLTCGFHHRGDRPTYHPARLVQRGEARVPVSIETLTWSGSADLRTAALADGFAVFAPGDHEYAPGDIVSFLPTR